MSFWVPFWEPFGSHVGLIGAPGGSLRLPMGAPRAFLGALFQHLFATPLFGGFWLPLGIPNPGYGGTAAHPLGEWEKYIFSHRMVKSLWGNVIWANHAFSAPVRRGELLRGEVSQGSTSPLKSLVLFGLRSESCTDLGRDL